MASPLTEICLACNKNVCSCPGSTVTLENFKNFARSTLSPSLLHDVSSSSSHSIEQKFRRFGDIDFYCHDSRGVSATPSSLGSPLSGDEPPLSKLPRLEIVDFPAARKSKTPLMIPVKRKKKAEPQATVESETREVVKKKIQRSSVEMMYGSKRKK